MIPVESFKGRKVALFGLGGSGTSTARALVAGGADVLAFDDATSRVDAAAALGIRTGDLRDADWSEFAALVLAPGVPLTHPRPHWSVELARAAGIEVIGDIELFCRERRRVAPQTSFVAITGTNGKSTTTALIAHLVKSAGRDVQLGGNIGTPVLDLAPIAAGRTYVVECSSYQIDLAPTLDPSVGIHLNLTPDHLDRHGTMQNYAAVKEHLISGSDFAVVGVDDTPSAAIADRAEQAGKPVSRISVRRTVARGVYAQGQQLFVADDGRQEPFTDLAGIDSLRGSHNAQNAAAAVAAALRLGLTREEIVRGLKTFPGLSHRMEIVAREGRVLFVNDSKATNADAAERALASFSRIYWIAGGRPKAGGIAPLADYFPRIARAYLIGEAAEEFAGTLDGKADCVVSGTLDEAVAAAARDAAADDHREPVVLLSPACASFDQFPNFELRGAAFVDAVKRVIGKPHGREVA
ncbi:UDP-N-acetylmuramoyl-L-alanine--D-glutamate ligase [Stappia sp. F7233]|uniref:UDP-N-acetylmuramoylalanine--D-glutamate ligase n=1 Tax=Stappia albiluteola TaxID=2758565 RepID=A0A839AGZ9_9HYPH|nr:UDP-N-acetylmuramoyl-L-alanine--D-glutamate ligase [Stappia albiluteola]MBA5777809.1 UDP-N-acetylmuramoyl-L-alanine--D-glutamate ligase [Stappia albiluteola]